MCRHLLLFLTVIYLANGYIRNYDSERNSMMGVDTTHDVKIDKDTVITRNLKIHKRGRKNQAPVSETDPDWSYSSFPNDVVNHVQQFKRNMSECLKEVQASKKQTTKRLSPKMDSPVHGECLIACVLKRSGVIENMKIHKDNLLALVSKFYAKDTKLMKKLERNLDRCIDLSTRKRIQDECQLASQLNDCTNDLMAINKRKLTVNY